MSVVSGLKFSRPVDPHLVPLSSQAVSILRELHPLTGAGRYVFPGERTATRSMSENTVNGSLLRIGFTSCRIPDDHISVSRLPLFLAREVLCGLAEDLKTCDSGELPL